MNSKFQYRRQPLLTFTPEPANVAGPVLVNLDAPSASGSSKGCVDLDKAKVKDIIQNAANYYVNVHNAEFADGAIRGQLSE